MTHRTSQYRSKDTPPSHLFCRLGKLELPALHLGPHLRNRFPQLAIGDHRRQRRRLILTPSSAIAANRAEPPRQFPVSARRITIGPALNPHTATVFPFPENPQKIGLPR